ncbi:MAG: hypothetical protein NTX91_03245 [candidate division SR1 bacterium]|nr:hypothetical protein [candidate division SR1 bacterium]
MTTQRRILKFFIIIILAVFLLATALTSVMYLAGKGPTTDVASGADSLSGAQTSVVETPAVDTGKALPTMTKAEAQKQLEQLLGGKKK